jgi:SAM-dependent methyltransferase
MQGSQLMNDLDLLIDLHRDGERQGPGGTDATRLSITLSGVSEARGLRIADIGCGTGASSLVLARHLNAHVTAADFIPAFIERLNITAEQEGIGKKVTTLTALMDALPFEERSFDAIWSEGAIYNMGFENGVQAWRRFLKPAGILAVSELTWLTGERLLELEEHWIDEYPEVATASAKLAILEANDFSPVGYFPLTEHCWLDNYYRPMQRCFTDFLSRHAHSEAASAMVETEEKEIAL